MRHGLNLPRVSFDGGGQFTRANGQVIATSRFRVSRSVRPNFFDWFYARDARLSDQSRPFPFDVVASIDATAGLGSEQFIFGTLNQDPATQLLTVPTPTFGRTPAGYRGIIDGIAPFAQDVFGNSVPIEMLAGTAIRWRIYINGRAGNGYDNITRLLDSWSTMAQRPLLELGNGDLFQASILVSSNGMGIARAGMRIRGRWENQNRENGERGLYDPLDAEWQSQGQPQAHELRTLPQGQPQPSISPSASVRRAAIHGLAARAMRPPPTRPRR